MTDELGAMCDEFHASCRLYLKLDLSPERETALHFFDRIRKQYTGLRKMRRTGNDSLVLEEESDENGSRRWVRLDRASLRFGEFVPADLPAFRQFGSLILEQAPFHLSFNDLDYDHLEVIHGFDLEFRGNHDQLVAETLLGDLGAAGFLFGDNVAHVIDAQPFFGVALSPDCDLQACVEVKSRTTSYEVRSATYEGQAIGVYLTVRKYWGLDPEIRLVETFHELCNVAATLAAEKVVPHFVNPLAAAIASRS
jgi:hypothetical protein